MVGNPKGGFAAKDYEGMTNGINGASFRPAITMQHSDVGNDGEKYSGEEYFAQEQQEEEKFRRSFFVDKSAQLRASLSFLANSNLARIIRAKKQKEDSQERKKKNQKEKSKNQDENQL